MTDDKTIIGIIITSLVVILILLVTTIIIQTNNLEKTQTELKKYTTTKIDGPNCETQLAVCTGLLIRTKELSEEALRITDDCIKQLEKTIYTR